MMPSNQAASVIKHWQTGTIGMKIKLYLCPFLNGVKWFAKMVAGLNTSGEVLESTSTSTDIHQVLGIQWLFAGKKF